MANVSNNNASIFMQWSSGSEKWISVCKNSPWVNLITNPTTLENYCFNIFKKCFQCQGLHSWPQGHLICGQPPSGPRRTKFHQPHFNPNTFATATLMAGPGSLHHTEPHASPCYSTGLQGVGNGTRKWQKLEGNDLYGKFSLFIF